MAEESGYAKRLGVTGKGKGWTWGTDDAGTEVVFPMARVDDYPGECRVLPPGAVVRIDGRTGEGEILIPE